MKTNCIKKREAKPSETTGEPKELWKSLKSLGMPNKTVIPNFNAIEENDTLTYEARLIFKKKIFFQT